LLEIFPKETASHLALSALANWTSSQSGAPTVEDLTAHVIKLLPSDTALPHKEIHDALGEMSVPFLCILILLSSNKLFVFLEPYRPFDAHIHGIINITIADTLVLWSIINSLGETYARPMGSPIV
jgi:hypothetical protein